MSRLNLFLLLLISSSIVHTSCEKQKDFMSIFEEVLNSDNLLVDNEFVDRFEEKLLENYPDRGLVIREINDRLVPTFEDFSDIGGGDKGNFVIFITKDFFLVNYQSDKIDVEMKNYMETLKRESMNVGVIDLIMLSPEKEKITYQECKMFISSIREADKSLDFVRDSISQKRYGNSFFNLDAKKKEAIRDEYKKIFILYLFNEIDSFLLPPPPVSEGFEEKQ